MGQATRCARKCGVERDDILRMERERPKMGPDRQDTYEDALLRQSTRMSKNGTMKMQISSGPPSHFFKEGHRILTVGDGDLSFSLSISEWFWFLHDKKKKQGKSMEAMAVGLDKKKTKGNKTTDFKIKRNRGDCPVHVTATSYDSLETLNAIYDPYIKYNL